MDNEIDNETEFADFTKSVMKTFKEAIFMSNLDGYQVLTTLAKKVGGHGKLIALIAGGGAVVGGIAVKGGEFAVKKGKQAYAKHKKKKTNVQVKLDTIYTIKHDAESNEGLRFKVGHTFRVLEFDGDAILIELIGNDNNPYFVSGELLKEISDYTN